MRVTLNVGACQGAGNCVAVAPDVFDYDEDALKGVLLDARPGAEHDDAVRAAELGCPAMAIVVDDD
jgi:ferredoxin